MNGLHGIIFAYEKAPGLRELTEAPSTATPAPSPMAAGTG